MVLFNTNLVPNTVMGSIQIRYADNSDKKLWDDYVSRHPEGTLSHLFGWRNIIFKTYGHESYYLMAFGETSDVSTQKLGGKDNGKPQNVLGVLPIFHFKNIVFGNFLVSLPFLDTGGVLADSPEIERVLLQKAVELGKKLDADRIEMRHVRPVFDLSGTEQIELDGSNIPFRISTESHKVRMVLSLPETPEALMKSFKSKLRSQIKKPLKLGLECKVGNAELLEEFYSVFSENMRDLGSPVHSRRLMSNVLEEFGGRCKILTVLKSKVPVAAGFIIGYKENLFNPWASFLRRHSSASPNMLLYLRMLEYGCVNGYEGFDFGRSSAGGGTYKFKEQWGAKPNYLHWQVVSLRDRQLLKDRQLCKVGFEKKRFLKAKKYWKILPLPIARILGPVIRKHIAL
jgi:FemAB-related protein (PEP-CTERM system-associated)